MLDGVWFGMIRERNRHGGEQEDTCDEELPGFACAELPYLSNY